jgi:glycosyltransferase involved in cell wall biosynthesis
VTSGEMSGRVVFLSRRSQSNKTDISLICFPFSGNSVGGSLISSIHLMKVLSTYSRCQVIVAVGSLGDGADLLIEHGFQVTHWREFKGITYSGSIAQRIRSLFYGVICARRRIIRENIDVVHTNDAVFHLIWSVACRLTRCHHFWHQRTKVSLSRATHLGLFMTTAIICISKYVQSMMPSMARSKAHLLVNPIVAGAEASSMDRTHRGNRFSDLSALSSQGKTLVGFIGVFNNQKRILDFLAIVEELKHDTDKHFLIVGKDGDFSRTELTLFVQKKELENLVTIYPFTRNIRDIFDLLDILVAPAVDEASGRVLLEAMEAGVLVIASSSGGHREIVCEGKTGFLVDPGNITVYARRISDISKNSRKHDVLRERARDFVLAEHSIERFSLGVKKIYNPIIHEL